MKNRLMICFSIVVSVSFVNGVSNSDLPNMGHDESSPLRGSKPYGFELALQGLHAVNKYHWFLTTKNTADTVESIQKYTSSVNKEKKPIYGVYNKVYVAKHNFYDLAIVKFKAYKKDRKNEHESLSCIATSEILDVCPWVLSLSKIGDPENISLKDHEESIKEDICLAAVSHVKETDDSYLFLEKGNMDDFYRVGRQMWKNLLIDLHDKEIKNHSNNWNIHKDHKPIIIKEAIEERKKIKYDPIKRRLKKLKRARNSIVNNFNNIQKTIETLIVDKKCFNFNEDKFKSCRDIALKSKTSLLSSIDEKIIKDKTLLTEALQEINCLKTKSLDEPEIDHIWNRYLQWVRKIEEQLKKDKQETEQENLTNETVDWYWRFYNTSPCNGIANISDAGGGIYSYPINFRLIALSEKVSQLIGITVPIGIEGETSVALNLTTPKMREWMLNSMHEYYKNKRFK